MFEKEAEEYADNREVCGLLDAISENLQNYDYGTVAHYNIDPLVEECFKDGAEFGYNKANEWNRVDEGKYPNEEQLGESFIVAFAFNEKTQEYYSFDCAEYIDKGKFCTHTNNDDKVIAWKEIVSPKEIKEK